MSEITATSSAAAAEDVDALGPVDWIVVEFPGARFDGSVIPILVDLEERGIIRVLDLVVLKKDADGMLEFFELSDLDASEIGGLRDNERQLAMVLSEDDLVNIAAAVKPGSAAAVLVWENSWAAPFGSAVRKVGGQLVASGRSRCRHCLPRSKPTQTRKEPEMPLARRRIGGPGVVAGTSRPRRGAVATVAVVSHGVDRRQDRRDDRGDDRRDRR